MLGGVLLWVGVLLSAVGSDTHIHVSLLEAPVAMLVQLLAKSRRRANGLGGATVLVLGLPSAMSFGLLSEMRIEQHGTLDAADATVSNLFLPIRGILLAFTLC